MQALGKKIHQTKMSEVYNSLIHGLSLYLNRFPNPHHLRRPYVQRNQPTQQNSGQKTALTATILIATLSTHYFKPSTKTCTPL